MGTDQEIRALCTPETRVVDLHGQVVLPGLIDSHLHINNTGAMKLELNVVAKQRREIVDMVAQAYQTIRPGEWIVGRGWLNDEWPDSSFPTKEELDAVAPDVPVYLKRACGHAAWVNSKAFEAVGVTDATPDPVGGEYLRKPDGTLLGVVTDQAQDPFNKAIPPYNKEQLQKIVLLAQESFFAAGLTTVHDAGTAEEWIQAWEELYQRRELKLRIYASMRVIGRPSYEELLHGSMEYFKKGLRIGMYGNRLTARAYKISGDGSLGARSAWMLDDYDDRPGPQGQRQVDRRAALQRALSGPPGRLSDLVSRHWRRGQPPVPEHLRAAAAGAARPRRPPAHRARPDYRARGHPPVQEAGRHPHAPDRVPAHRQKGGGYPPGPPAHQGRLCLGGPLIDQGNVVPNGTDSPVESYNPFLSMYCAVTRMDERGQPEGGWYPQEAMTREEALRSYTVWGAYAGFEEHLKGSIEAGKLADFVVIDRDYLACPAEEIKDIQVLQTVVGGETVYQRG